MKKYFSILIFIFSTQLLFAKHFTISQNADYLINDSVYEQIIFETAKNNFVKNEYDYLYFQSNYFALKDTIFTLSKSLIENKFLEIERKFSRKKISEKVASQLYKNAIQHAIQITLAKNNFLKNEFLKKDLNDRILSFDSKIKLHKDGLIDVTETIVIVNFDDNTGQYINSIKRGITRDFPTKYFNKYGLETEVLFSINSVRKNEQLESFFIKDLSNGKRIYCGSSTDFLPVGIYKYELKYSTNNQLKFHNDRDEFYWNITGNGWEFSIDKSSCEIEFPIDSKLFDINCYTGYQNEKAHNCNSIITKNSNKIYFETNQKLLPNQGFTISVSTNKNIFTEKNETEKVIDLFTNNVFLFCLAFIILGLFIVLFYYWYKVGRDPKAGIIIPTFEPPNGLSPAAVGFIDQQAYNDRQMAATIVDLCVQNKLRIEYESEGLILKSKTYKFLNPINRNGNTSSKKTYLSELSENELIGISLKSGVYNSSFKTLRTLFMNRIENKVLTKKTNNGIRGFLSLNTDYISLGILLLFLSFIASIVFFSVFKPHYTIVIYVISLLIIGIIIQSFFMNIIKAYTSEGRIVADKIAGFKMYLETTEKNKYDLMNPPEENLQLFEAYLPFAIALNVENKWSEKFKNVIESALEGGYKPNYYSGTSQHFYSGGSQSFASSLSHGLSNTVSSASTPPSSSGSSGSGGGGSSGGGGGGGGGGGW